VKLAPPKPLIVDQEAMFFFIQAGFAYLFGLLLLAWNFSLRINGEHETATWLQLGSAPVLVLGWACVKIGKLIQQRKNYKEETAARLAERDEQIRQLEAQLAAVTPPPTH
jgi:hypothetical protein